MTTQSGRSPFALAGACGALLFGFWCATASASSGFDVDCNEVTEAPPTPELPTPSLNVQVVDHGLVDASANIAAPPAALSADDMVAPTLVDDVADDGEDDDQASGPVSTPPETALRLPGVSEEELPRFRRQMYRTDI